MSRFRNAVTRTNIILASAGAACLVFVAGFGGFLTGGADALDRHPPTAVSFTIVRYDDGYQVRRAYAGQVAAGRVADVAFDQGGLLAEVVFDEGERVREGDVLARLDTRRLDAARGQAAAGLRAAEAALALAEATLRRQRQLASQDFSSKQRLDEAAAERDRAAADLAARRADLEAAEAALELALIRAPYGGEVARRFVDEGAVVNAGAPVLTLVETGVREVRLALPDTTAAALSLGERVEVMTDGGKTVSARLARLTRVVDQATRSRLAVFELEGEAGAGPAPGAVVRIPLVRRVEERGFWAPVAALSEGSRGLWRVMALVEDEAGEVHVRPRPVEVLHVEDDHAYLRGAAQEGDRIIASGVERVAPDQRVRPAGDMIAAEPDAP